MVEVSALKDAYLVAGLKDEQIAQVAALATIKLYSSGACLAQIGEPLTDLFIILSGTVKVTTHDGDLLGEVGANSVVGEMALVDALPSNGNVTAVGQVSAAAIPMANLRRLMAQNREWGFVILSNVSRVMAGRLRQTNARIDELCDQTVEPWDHSLG